MKLINKFHFDRLHLIQRFDKQSEKTRFVMRNDRCRRPPRQRVKLLLLNSCRRRRRMGRCMVVGLQIGRRHQKVLRLADPIGRRDANLGSVMADLVIPIGPKRRRPKW